MNTLPYYQAVAEPVVIYLNNYPWISFYERLYETYFPMFFNFCAWCSIAFNLYKVYTFMKTYKPVEMKDPLEAFKDEFYTEVDALRDAVKKIDNNLEMFKISSETCQNIVRESIEDTLETVNELKLASESSQKALQELVIRIRASGIRLI
jgi:hypothetical protein